MSELQEVRALYRVLLAAASRLAKQSLRHRTTDVFSPPELSVLERILPVLPGTILGGEGRLCSLVREEFRKPLVLPAGTACKEKEEYGKRLDVAYQVLSLVNRRIVLLERAADSSVSDSITKGVRVTVQSMLHPLSYPPIYRYQYTVRIANEGAEEPVQLVSRHWQWSDWEGAAHEVRGPGVVGLQPLLEPGKDFSYSSFMYLQQRRGTMWGTYQMMSVSGKLFDVEIKPFALKP